MASFSVVTNIASVNAQANLYQTNRNLNTTLTRLSSGLRINYSGDDAAGLGVANGYRSDLATLNQGILNANDGLSSLQIKDGALNNVSQLLDRLSTLATQAASGSTTDASRTILNNEFQDVLSEINRETTVANLNTSTGFSVFLSNNGTNGTISGTIAAVTTSTLGISSLAITAQGAATTAVSTIRAAIDTLATSQGKVGDLENRLNFAISLAQSQVVNDTAAESRIRDANIAQESANLTKYNILNQSGIASLAQANNSSSAVLALLR
ncbi:MAG: flagellin FliC [Acidobacteriota bacterium]|nr:flagellin FliC [Acidobacteriota bacterium]